MSGIIVDKLFVAMFTDNENERQVACNKLVSECIRRGWHPTEIKLLYGANLLERQHQMLEELTKCRDKLTEENFVLRNEIGLLRRHSSPKIRRRVRDSLLPPRSSKIFLDLATEKLFSGKRPRDWPVHVARFLGRPEEDIKTWQKPNATIPESVLDELRSAAPLPIKNRPKARRKSPKKSHSSKDKDPMAPNSDAAQPPLL